MLCHTMYSLSLHDAERNSLLMSCITPEQLVNHGVENNLSALCICDYHSLSGAIDFISHCQEKKIKPIIGCNFFTDDGFLTLVAKNKTGYFNLVKAISRSNDPDRYKNGPRIQIEDIDPEGLLLITGGYNSQLARCLFKYNEVYTTDPSRVSGLINNLAQDEGKELFNKYKDFEILIEINNRNSPVDKYINEFAQHFGNNLPTFSSARPHYIKMEDRIDELTILSMGLKTTLSKFKEVLSEKELQYLLPLMNDYVKQPPEWYNLCEEYDIFKKPELPSFGDNETEILRQLCREGYKKKNKNWDRDIYSERVKYELEVIEKAGLEGYFLIVADYIKWAKDQGIIVGPSRGSVGGSLVAYLSDIIEIDPIKYNLIFSRFFNSARASKGDLPDIDTDFPPESREIIINYIKTRHGEDKVSQISTFGRMMGSSILKEIIRVNNACSFIEANRITKGFPPEALIAGELEHVDKTEGVYSIIKWVLENDPKSVIDYCELVNGELVGSMSPLFKQAIKLEGIFKTQGKHAAGVVISKNKLNEVCPMINDKNSDHKITGYDMDSLGKIGIPKFDILAVDALSKVSAIIQDIG